MTAPRVTVVVACRDGADVLEHTIDDLFLQTDRSWELVVVDHGSVDEDAQARLHALRWPGTRALRIESPGLDAAFRAGAGAARGECILFLRAGDRLKPAALRKLVAALDAEPLAIAAVDASGPNRGGRPGLVRCTALSMSAPGAAADPVAALVASGARTVVVPEPLVEPGPEPPPHAPRSVRARSLGATAAAPGMAPATPAGERGAVSPPVGQNLPIELGEALRRLGALSSALREARHDIAALRSSASWRITAPLRLAHRWLTRGGR